MSRAAASISRNVDSALRIGRIDEYADTAAPGTSSRKSSSRFATNSAEKKLTPVRLPPGRVRLATRPSLTGSSLIRRRLELSRSPPWPPAPEGRRCHDYGDLAANQFGRQRRQPIVLIFGPAIFDRHVFSLDIAGLPQTLPERRATFREPQAIERGEPDHRHRRLLRARRERPHAAAPPSSVMNSRRFMGSPPQAGSRTLPHRCARTLLCSAARLLIEWQRWVNRY